MTLTRPTLHQIALWLVALIPFGLVWSRGGADMCVSLIAFLFLVHCVHQKNWGWFKTPYAKWMFMTWALLLFVVTPFAVVPMDSIGRALTWIRYPLFFAAVTCWVIRDKKHLRFVMLPLVLLFIFIIVDTIVQYFTGTSLSGNPVLHQTEWTIRLTGPFNNAKVGVFTAKLLLPILATFLLVAWIKNRRAHVAIAAVIMLTSMLMLLLSGERSALINGSFGLGAAFLLVAYYNPKYRWPAAGLIALLGIGMLLIISTQPVIQERMQALIEQTSGLAESAYGKAWTIAFGVFMKSPLTGVGLHNYYVACSEFIQTNPVANRCEYHSHNPYLEWLSEAGIFGLISFVWFVGWLVWQVLREVKQGKLSTIDSVLLAAAFGVIVVNFFPFMSASSTFSNWPAMLLWFSLAIGMSLLNLLRKVPHG